KEMEDVYSSRQMTFVGQQPVIKHKCRAPLTNGKLCPRMDLEICPFHGPIVPRDEMGFPVEELGKGSVFVKNIIPLLKIVLFLILEFNQFIIYRSIEHLKLAEERIKRH